MAIAEKNIRLIFGLKLRQLRQERALSLSDLSKKTKISVSYLNEIEKGKKRPKSDKIALLAEVLDVSYDWLVSLKLNPKLQPLSDLLHSNILNELPLEMFGLEPGQLLEIFTNAPSKFSAFVSTLIEINRSYDMSVEGFYFSVLRSYQEMHNNFFESLEINARECRKQFHLQGPAMEEEMLTTLLQSHYCFQIHSQNFQNLSSLQNLRSIMIPSTKPELWLNPQLKENQRMFILGRELGFLYLNLKERPLTSSWAEVHSFDEVLNNFKASYFSSALLIEAEKFVEQLKKWFVKPRFDADFLLKMLSFYHVTPETLFHRMTNLLPKFFDINQLFFLRFNHDQESDTYQLSKEMHLAGLHNPHASLLKEHYCRRWVAISIIQEGLKSNKPENYACNIQRSKFLDSHKEYLVISVSHRHKSISLGLLITPELKEKIRFIDDPAIPVKEVNETCERCGLKDCLERAAPAVKFEEKQQTQRMRKALHKIFKDRHS